MYRGTRACPCHALYYTRPGAPLAVYSSRSPIYRGTRACPCHAHLAPVMPTLPLSCPPSRAPSKNEHTRALSSDVSKKSMLYLFRKNQRKVSCCEEEIEKSTMSLLGGGRPAGWDVPAVATCFPDELHLVLPGLMPITTCHCRVFRTALGRSPIYRGT